MTLFTQIGLYILSALLVCAGISHFLRPRFYARMLPLWLPAHKFLVGLTGLLEIGLGLGLLLESTRSMAAWATVVLLGIYLIIHIHMLIDKEAGMGLPKWALGIRILLQFVLIYWALMYT